MFHFLTIIMMWIAQLPLVSSNAELENLIEVNESILKNYARLLIDKDQSLEKRCSAACIPEATYACTSYSTDALSQLETISDFGSTETCQQKGCSSRKIQFETSNYRTPTTMSSSTDATLGMDICLAKEALEAEFVKDGKAGYEKKDAIKWRYLGSPTGVFTQYPSASLENCDNYDPRNRPWYVGATSGPKDVALILDISGSMGQMRRVDIMKEAVSSVLDTLNSNDFFNIITFSSSASYLDTSITAPIAASGKNIQKFKNLVNKLEPEGGTKFKLAFEKAFDLFSQTDTDTSGCHKLILFLTDGSTSDSETDVLDAAKSVSDLDVTIFTYTFGSGAEFDIPQKIACASDGIWGHVADGGDLRSKMSQYYQYYEVLKSGDQSTVFWSEPYEDASGLGMVTTASLSVYDERRTPPVLIGVLGIDVTTDALKEIEPNFQTIIQLLNARSKRCPLIVGKGEKLRECVLERLREIGSTSVGKCKSASFCADITTSLKTTHQEKCATARDYTYQTFQGLPDTNPSYVEQACCAEAEADGNSLIIGLIAGAVLLVTCFLAYCCCCRTKKRKHPMNRPSTTQVQQPVHQPVPASNNMPYAYPVQQQQQFYPPNPSAPVYKTEI